MKLIPKGGGNWRDLNEDIVEKAMGEHINQVEVKQDILEE